MESLSNLEKIMEDIGQDSVQSYKILHECDGILISSWEDPTVFERGLYEILQDPTVY